MEPNNNTNNPTPTNNPSTNPNPPQAQVPPKPVMPPPAPVNKPMQKPMATPPAPNRSALWWIIAIIIILVIIVMFAGKKNAAAPESPSIDDQTSVVPTETPTENTTSSSLTYDEAIAAYAGKMISFTATPGGCVATPSTAMFSVGSRILLTNGGTADVTIAAAGKTVTLKQYHYATVTLPVAGSVSVTCNNQADVALVTVQ